MRELRVETEHPYMVHIGQGAVKLLAERYSELLVAADRIVVIADSQVAELHLDKLFDALEGFHPKVLRVPAGEKAKSAESFMDCHSFLLSESCSRNTVILAFGGGAVGDLAGFVASTFMRGVPFIQVPTTILAHDSAVGGKTAINHPLGKNMIGTFYQPRTVVYDSDFLETLPENEIRSGMAEVIKHAFISNEGWLDELMAYQDFGAVSGQELEGHLEKGIAVKSAIVEEDEFEGGVRKFLNFGHTLAHAIEAHLGYGKLTHGEAVVLGMAYALELSESPELQRFLDWAKVNSYPLGLLMDMSFGELLPYMKKDKKSTAAALNFVLLGAVGRPYIETIPEQHAQAAYDKLRKTIKEMI
ncbi:3-dehydroquinate synthase [Planococcus sp. CP5-4]|uniref:3-dehydroquinate synthase n=1 Tax=unclassified Planococcus (in: firmicutes) TaxID=2662419 RepID=UPI001C23ACD3|nr:MULTISPECIES: 3-dehydroquinate synthase [unclassified Planococcus (in: firmicutes)]MBU9671963.1 3-dehydroquinate synthase [Planococcus sp. CP5-4_YE]MBV0907526.1 3-dehydroquinate synthase [Planococcus sp. CP5-4_UN]MBW6062693.1 3-dehydroquinate synthase [Planococcus sp. CP5-4]